MAKKQRKRERVYGQGGVKKEQKADAKSSGGDSFGRASSHWAWRSSSSWFSARSSSRISSSPRAPWRKLSWWVIS